MKQLNSNTQSNNSERDLKEQKTLLLYITGLKNIVELLIERFVFFLTEK